MTFKLMVATVAIMSVLAPPDNWKSDAANAKISFTIKGPFGTVNGKFTGLKTEIRFDEKNVSGSSISASIDAQTVSTGVGLRNRDLRKKEEWFNTDKYPLISFRSKKTEKSGTSYKVLGELTIKGITKPVEIPFTFTSKGNDGVFKGKFLIKREDYNLGKPGGSVGSEVTITLEVPVKK